MPHYHDDALQPSPRIVVTGSIAMELDWAMAAAWRPEFTDDHPALTEIYKDAPKLGEQVRAFWGEGERTSYGSSIELLVIAHQHGLLLTLDAEALLAGLEAACAQLAIGEEHHFALEGAEDRAVLRGRLAHLASSAGLRRRYVALVRDVWSAVAPAWDRHGRAVVEETVASMRGRLERGATWRDVSGKFPHCAPETVQELESKLGPDGTIAVLPAYFAHLYSLVDVPKMLLIGVKAVSSGADARARNEQLARRLKTLSDPTRLAMLEVLGSRPQTVTELASYLSLAQPTVSNHVKLLRDAGVVANATGNDRRKLVVEREALAELLGDLGNFLAQPLEPTH